MTGYLLDDPMFMVEDKERKEKVDKVFSDVEQLEKESKLSDRYTCINCTAHNLYIYSCLDEGCPIKV